MIPLAVHLRNLPLLTLQGIAQKQGLLIESESHKTFADDLAAQMQDAENLRELLQTLPESAQIALNALILAENRIPAAVFQRRYGDVRRFGPGRLQQEQPWTRPDNTAEVLWYAGLLARGFDDTPDGFVEFFGVPAELLALLPPPATSAQPLQLSPAEPPTTVRDAGERFLDDLATLLIYVQNERVWLNSRGRWRHKDVQALMSQMLAPPADPAQPLARGDRPALLFFCAGALGFLVADKRRQRLDAERVRAWLQLPRPQQAHALFAAWRAAETWNDLCRTPGLRCDSGNWRNEPLTTRRALLALLQQVEPEKWFEFSALIEAVHRQQPDFQRANGNYETWYIRDDANVFLKGFENWIHVEGRLIRHMWSGPLFWLGITAVDAETRRWSLTRRGRAFLDDDPAALISGAEPVPALVIGDDFSIHLPPGADVYDRLRVARFCRWESSWPGYRYRISQRGLRRLNAAGVSPAQVLDFLMRAGNDAVPANVRKALSEFRP